MTCLPSTLTVSGIAPALLTLPHPLTPQALLEVEHAVCGTLGLLLSRDLLGAAVGTNHEIAVRRTEAAEIEYASWLPDRGATEVASWARHLRSCLR